MPEARRPTMMDIATGIGCSCACSYCPQDVLLPAYGERGGPRRMTLELFRECCGKIPRSVTIAFAGMAEPWLNPDCTLMLEWASAAGHNVQAFTTTAGMTMDDVERLARVPSLYMVVHLPSAEEHERITLDSAYLSVLAALLAAGHVDHCHCHGRAVHPLVETTFERRFGRLRPITRIGRVPIEYAPPQGRAGNVEVEGGITTRRRGRRYCLRSFQNLLLPNGDVLVCSLDYGMRHVIGNLTEQDYESLFSGEQYRLVQRGLEDDALDVLCRSCECALRPLSSYRLRQWFKKEYEQAQTPSDLLAIAPKFVRTAARHLTGRAGAEVELD